MYGVAKKIWQKGEPTPDRRIKRKHLEAIWLSSGDNN